MLKLSERPFRIALVGLVATSVALALLAGAARSATTSFNRKQTILFDGRPTFPLVLSPGPPLGAKTPWGTDALTETASAGVNVYRTGTGGIWSPADINTALAWDRAAAALGVYTWPNLGGYSQAVAGSSQDEELAQVVDTLTTDPSGSAIAMWKGRDEPWYSNIAPSALQFAYCRVTGRGDPSWCDGEAALDPSRLWVTIEAPRGTAAALAPYSSVTDVHGVDIYPVTVRHQTSPNLQAVGIWTATLASIAPLQPVWTTIQICASGSSDKSTGEYVLPTYQQERYMAYDAILNGAKALTFYGGNNTPCFSGSDATYGWNWSFWLSVLKPLVEQLSATSPLAPALVNTAKAPHVTTGSGTQTMVRQGTSVDDLWVIAARSGLGTRTVTFKGLPNWVHRGGVYTENRTILASNGSFHDRFARWAVHVYHFVEPIILRKFAPATARVGAHVTLQGKGLAATKGVSFGGAKAHFRIVNDGKVVATVPKRAKSGPIVVTSPLKQVRSRTPFRVLAGG